MNASARGFGIVLFAPSLLVAVSCGVEDPPIDDVIERVFAHEVHQ